MAQVNLPACSLHCSFNAKRQASLPFFSFATACLLRFHQKFGARILVLTLSKVIFLIKSKKIGSLLHSRKHAEACNEWRGEFRQLSA